MRWEIIPFLKEHKWLFLLFFAFIAFSLGIIGFHLTARAHGEALPLPDLAYLSLQLFVFNSGAAYYPTATSLPLNVARFLAPATTLTTVIILVLHAFYRLFQDSWLRYFVSDHAIICGMGYVGPVLARVLMEKGSKVIIIEKDLANKELEIYRGQGAIILPGDASEEYYLRKARISRAKYLFSVTGDDETNSRIALHARNLMKDREQGYLNCCIHLVDPNFVSLLRVEQLAATRESKIRMEFFNIYQIAGLCLVSTSPTFAGRDPPEEPVHLLIVGVGRMGENFIVHAVRTWRDKFYPKTRKKIRISFIDRHAGKKKALLEVRYPSLSRYCDLKAHQMDLESETFFTGAYLFNDHGECDITGIYICTADESLGLSAGLTLYYLLKNPEIPITVRTTYTGGLAELFNQLNLDTREFRNFRAFPLVSCSCCVDLLTGGIHEIIARAIHDAYVEQQERAGVTPDVNPSMRPWGDLSPDLQDSSRKQADHIWDKLEKIHCGVIPLTDWEEPPLVFTDSEVEFLARAEHERWINDMISKGYRFGPEKDDVLRTRPTIVPWDRMPEDEKEKDRNAVRSLPLILKAVDLKIIRLSIPPSSIPAEHP